MLDYYFIKEKVIQTDEKNFNWLVINNSDTEEIGRVNRKYQLPEDIFIGNSYPEEVSPAGIPFRDQVAASDFFGIT